MTDTDEMRPAEAWRDALDVPAWKHAGASVLARWGAGRELTERAYRAGIEAFEAHSAGRD